MQWRKWRNWRKIASRWRFELDAKSGLLEAGDFGENGDRRPRISAPLGAKKKFVISSTFIRVNMVVKTNTASVNWPVGTQLCSMTFK